MIMKNQNMVFWSIGLNRFDIPIPISGKLGSFDVDLNLDVESDHF